MSVLNWGILSTANIGIKKVIPGMLKSDQLTVSAIASRNLTKAREAADDLGIEKAYGSYEALIDDPSIDVIYNPLPNHLHVEWTARAIKAGKHVLCEKPLFIDLKDVEMMMSLRDEHQVKVGEAFMVKSHPQWQQAKAILQSGSLGEVKSYRAAFSYYNTDPDNIRNIAKYGGGALWDIGCYPVMTARYLFDENPVRVLASITKDSDFGTDILTEAIMEFSSGQKASFTVSTQLAPYQRVQLLGTKKQLEITIPFNAPTNRATTININDADILLEHIQTETVPVCDQYQLQAEDFSRAVMENTAVPVSLEDAADHCRIITAMFEGAASGTWSEIK